MDGQQEFSVGELEASVQDDAPVPSIPSVHTDDPDLSEIVARSRARSIERSRQQVPPPPPSSFAPPAPGPAMRPQRKVRETEQTLRMQAISLPPPPHPAQRSSSFLVDLILVLGIITFTLILATVLIFTLR